MTPEVGAALWVAEGSLIAAVAGTYLVRRHLQRLQLGADLALLQAASWSLVRGMENYPRRSASKRGADRTALVREFAFEATKLGRPLPMTGESTLDIVEAPFEVIDRNEKDGSAHWRQVNGLRRGAFSLLALYWLGNTQAAFLSLTEHMRVQSRLDEGACTNLTELKMLFGLPIEWPKTSESAETAERQGFTLRRHQEIMRAVNKGFTAVAATLVYQPWPEGRMDQSIPEEHKGEAILEAIRGFIR